MPPLAIDDRRRVDRLMVEQAPPHLLGLDALAADLDLLVTASDELDVAVRAQPRDIAGPVQPTVARVRHESLGGEVRLVSVTMGDARAHDAELPSRDPKSELQERVQALGGASPRYQLMDATGPDHRREFLVRVEALGRILGEGRGRSKKSAEQEAARQGLSALAKRP